MRSEFIETLIELAKKDPRIMLLTGDLGYTVIEPFAESFPNRFFNVGVAEQNMVGVATGLAEAGFIPFLYSISSFASMRPYEFIRNGPIHHKLPVRIIGIGGGFEYGSAGRTHYGLEDIGIMRIQEGITVVVPADCKQAKTALMKTWDLPGPIYYRIAKGGKDNIPNLNGQFELGRAKKIRDGGDLVFVSAGNITREVILAADKLLQKGISCSVVVVSSFNPSPENDLVAILKDFKVAIAVEDHYITGGIGSFVAEVISENGLTCRLVRSGVKSLISGITGNRDYMNEKYGISSQKLTETAERSIKESRK